MFSMNTSDRYSGKIYSCWDLKQKKERKIQYLLRFIMFLKKRFIEYIFQMTAFYQCNYLIYNESF